MAHAHWLGEDEDDRLAYHSLTSYDAEACQECGVHKETWQDETGRRRRPDFVFRWSFCAMCSDRAKLLEQGPPGGKKAKGWHLVLIANPPPEEVADAGN